MFSGASAPQPVAVGRVGEASDLRRRAVALLAAVLNRRFAHRVGFGIGGDRHHVHLAVLCGEDQTENAPRPAISGIVLRPLTRGSGCRVAETRIDRQVGNGNTMVIQNRYIHHRGRVVVSQAVSSQVT